MRHVIAHAVRRVALATCRAVLEAANQAQFNLSFAVRRHKVPVFVVAVLHHRHAVVVAVDELHVPGPELIRRRSKLDGHPVRARVDLPREVITLPCAEFARPDVEVAVTKEASRRLARLDGDDGRVVGVAALPTVGAERRHEFERVGAAARLGVDRVAVGAAAVARLLVHDHIEVSRPQLVARAHLDLVEWHQRLWWTDRRGWRWKRRQRGRREALVIDSQVLVRSSTWVAEDLVGCTHRAGALAAARFSHDADRLRRVAVLVLG